MQTICHSEGEIVTLKCLSVLNPPHFVQHVNYFLKRQAHNLTNKAHTGICKSEPSATISPFLITKPVWASGQLKLSICEHSKTLSSMNIYPEAPGEIPQHCPGLSLCLFPSPVLALHLRLCLPTQKLPAYTTSQVTALSGFQLAPELPRVYSTSQKPNSNPWASS